MDRDGNGGLHTWKRPGPAGFIGPAIPQPPLPVAMATPTPRQLQGSPLDSHTPPNLHLRSSNKTNKDITSRSTARPWPLPSPHLSNSSREHIPSFHPHPRNRGDESHTTTTWDAKRAFLPFPVLRGWTSETTDQNRMHTQTQQLPKKANKLK